jgi:ribosomal protein L10
MPTYDQAISMLMSVMQAPIQKLAQTMNEVPGKLVRTVAAFATPRRPPDGASSDLSC